MTKQEVKQIEGQFGEMYINGSIYHKIIHGFIREVNYPKVRIERLEGCDLIINCKDLISMKKKREPVLT